MERQTDKQTQVKTLCSHLLNIGFNKPLLNELDTFQMKQTQMYVCTTWIIYCSRVEVTLLYKDELIYSGKYTGIYTSSTNEDKG